MASEWLSSGLGLPASYSGAENSDGGTGLTLCTQFSTVSAGWITKIRFWKTSIDTATSRTVGIYRNDTHALVTSQVTSGEPVGTAQWIEVTLTTPLALTAHTVLTEGFYVAVAYDQQKYPATGAVFNSVGYYTSGSHVYLPATAESDDIGGIGNGAFRYNTSGLIYPDGSFGGGYYWVDALWTDVDPSGSPATFTFAVTEGADLSAFSVTSTTSLSFNISEGPDTAYFVAVADTGGVGEDAFQADAFMGDTFQTHIEAGFNIFEGADLADFDVTSTTYTSFNVTEGPDVAAFNVVARTYVSFNILEGPDVADFDVTSTTQLSFNITEGPDIPHFAVLTGAMFSFHITEGPDIPSFRTWTGDFTLGDADYIVVPYELRTSSVPYDAAQIDIRPEDTKSNLQDEWQRIDVDQTRGRRDT